MRSLSDNALKFFRLLAGRRRSYPEEIQIEVTNACNLTCSMCPHTLGLIPQNHFPYSLFEQLIQKNPAPKRLVLTGWGEPLMHPQFFEFIALANLHQSALPADGKMQTGFLTLPFPGTGFSA
jgi:molybdenum cofactor biosynthesis enzyme MoaA